MDRKNCPRESCGQGDLMTPEELKKNIRDCLAEMIKMVDEKELAEIVKKIYPDFHAE